MIILFIFTKKIWSPPAMFFQISHWISEMYTMNSMKLVIPLHSLYWSIHTKDESKRGTTFAFIFGVNGLWHCGVTLALFGVFIHEIKFNGMTSFTEFAIPPPMT